MTKATVAIILEVERAGARTTDLERFLTKEVSRAMGHARLFTPAAPKMLSIRVVCTDNDQTQPKGKGKKPRLDPTLGRPVNSPQDSQ